MNTEVVKKFWQYIDGALFDKLSDVMTQDANVILANTDEIFIGRDNYIQFNKVYPGRWYAKIKCIIDAGDEVVTAVKITNDDNFSLYVTSFFKLEKGLIKEIVEFWGENGDAPEWRKQKGYCKEYSF